MLAPVDNTAQATAQETSASMSSLSSSTTNKDDEEVEVLDEPPPLEPRNDVHPSESAKWDAVIVSLESVNLVKKAGAIRTRIVSISGSAIPTLSVANLRKFCSNHCISKTKKKNKVELCAAILDGKAKHEKGIPDGGVIVEVTVKEELPISRIRLLNVLFGDKIRPLLALRGKVLTAAELTEGKKTDSDLFDAIAKEYGSTESNSYGQIAYPDLGNFKAHHPSRVSSITAKKIALSFKMLLREYECCFNKWKLSGTHEEMNDNIMKVVVDKPFADFANNQGVMMYFHKFLQLYPDILANAVGKLSADAFSESINGTPTMKGEGKVVVKMSTSANKNAAAIQAFNTDQVKRTKSISGALLTASVGSLEANLHRNKDRKRELMQQLYSHCEGNKRVAKGRLQVFIANKSESNNSRGAFSYDSDDDSQASLLEEIVDAQKSTDYSDYLMGKAREELATHQEEK